MKLIAAVLFACVALAAAELKWSEDGQYRLVDTEPMYQYLTYGAAVPAEYSLLPATAPYRLASYPLPYRTIKMSEYEPFYYSYQQISNDK